VKVLIISAQELHVPSGIPQMVNQIIGGLLSRGVSVTAVLSKQMDGLGLYKPAIEHYDSKGGRLAVEWLPATDFSHNGRESLLHYLETLIVREDVKHILAVGVRKAGFVSGIAARLRGKLFSAILTYRDAFECHLNAPYELDLVTEAAKFLIAPNPFVLQHLECFYSLGDRAFWLEMLPNLLDSKRINLEEDLRYRETVSLGRTYLCTTGNISPLVDVAELLDRVIGLMHENVADRWIHVGTVDSNTLMHLSSRLSLLGMTDKFALTGILDRSCYRCVIQGARVIVKPAGEVDTGVGALEANGWQIPLSVPPEYPIWPLKPYPPRSEVAGPHRSLSFCTSRFTPTSLDVVLDRFLQ
jgi:hypothetical protein